MVAFENVHVFNCRSETRSVFRISFANNWPVVMAVFAAQTVHITAAFVPGLWDVLEMHPISVELWLTLVPIALLPMVVMEIFKIAWRRLANHPKRDAPPSRGNPGPHTVSTSTTR